MFLGSCSWSKASKFHLVYVLACICASLDDVLEHLKELLAHPHRTSNEAHHPHHCHNDKKNICKKHKKNKNQKKKKKKKTKKKKKKKKNKKTKMKMKKKGKKKKQEEEFTTSMKNNHNNIQQR